MYYHSRSWPKLSKHFKKYSALIIISRHHVAKIIKASFGNRTKCIPSCNLFTQFQKLDLTFFVFKKGHLKTKNSHFGTNIKFLISKIVKTWYNSSGQVRLNLKLQCGDSLLLK